MQFIGKILIAISIVWGVYIVYYFIRAVNAMDQYDGFGRIYEGAVYEEFGSQVLIPIILFVIGIAFVFLGVMMPNKR
jgi:hypothetical protein